MRGNRLPRTLLFAAICLGMLGTAFAGPKRNFTVRDSIEMSYFGVIASSTPQDIPDDGVFSPDGRHFVKITHRGDLSKGITEGTLWLFDTDSVIRCIRDKRLPLPRPTPLVRMGAAVNGGLQLEVLEAGNTVIAPTWSDDSRSLTFLGRNGRANRQLFKVDLGTGQIKPLSPANRDVLIYSRSGDQIAYLAGPDADVQEARAWNSSGIDIPDVSEGTKTPLMTLLYPHFRGYAYGEPLDAELWRTRADSVSPVDEKASASVIKLTTRYTSLLLSLSPDGTKAITIAETTNANTRVTPATGGDSNLQYQIVNLDSGNIVPLENAPRPDSNPNRHRIAWGTKGIAAVTGLDQTQAAPIALTVHEELNEPPALVATDSMTGKSRTIFDPNPQLSAIALGDVSIYRWTDPHGAKISGGLVIPPDFKRGQRYALMVQTHGFEPKRFFRSGYSDTANAGRALAARGMLLLQVQEPHSEHPSWRDGTEHGVDVYLAAVDKLSAEGLVDPARVGISGYSYSGWLVANAITHSPQRFAAAEIANSDPVTLTGYYEYAGTPLAKVVADTYVEARPYGAGLQTWMERVPSFATDRITAPVLFQPADPWHLIGVWDMYAALLDQGKPVELQYFRSGEHNLRKPLQVLAHQEMLVDWFDFWLNGHEDLDQRKAQQYERWRRLRSLQAEGLNK